MFSLDQYLTDILVGNYKTLLFIFAVLVGLAKESPWTWDERVLAVIIAPFRVFFDRLGIEKNLPKP